ncbi:nucleoside hydrolase-like [Saccoglossus kowalevskii]|uniref:Uridine nucleosidase 1-like n=1 Tax=Saccoglossus kowalevskii TaxID=10224 RepID=A0ABM0GKD5_SACKO|nr:PREDICTED: uridine nucleosidase 1-like [Saccoglossus kowalevskii]
MKMIIDTDAGIDDAEAIMMALANPHVEIVAITCVSGNTRAKQVTRNVLRILNICNRLDIPVYLGSEHCLAGDDWKKDGFHGSDGLGDAPDPENTPDESHIKSEMAVNALIRYVNEMKGELTLVTLGPLTNIALAMRLDADFSSKLKEMIVMGGNYQGRGNIVLGAEFNFYFDPVAAFAVLNECQCPVTIATWETCCDYDNMPSYEWFKKWSNQPTEKAKFIRRIREQQINKSLIPIEGRYFRSCDTVAMAAVLLPDVIVESVKKYATVELNGTLTRGQMVIDWREKLKKSHNVNIIIKINRDLYLDLMWKALE